jgi:hypothetical protein
MLKNSKNLPSSKKISLDIIVSRGINFLYSNQFLHGEFETLVSPDQNMNLSYECPVSSPYITTFILYSISFIRSQKVAAITHRALTFLIEEIEEPGVWSFYTKKNRKLKYHNGKFIKDKINISPDLDDTACVSYALKINKVLFKNNQLIFLNQRNQEGIFYTWLVENNINKSQPNLYNDVCCGVNANILLYLGQNKFTNDVCSFLNKILKNEKEMSYSIYFPNRFVIYYLVSRAYFNGVYALKESKDIIINKILSRQEYDYEPQDNLSKAFAICTLLNFDYFSQKINVWMQCIIDTQKLNGSWEKASFFKDFRNYYGSEELSTAICLEAIARFSEYLKQQK